MDFGNTIEELKELDLISQVERFPDENTESGVDCTLRLGLPNNEPEPETSLLSMNPKPAFTLPTINVQSRPSEVTGNSRMINRIATAYSTTFPWIPKLVNFNDSVGGFGFDGNHPSMEIPCIGSSNGSAVNGSRPSIAIPGKENSSNTSQRYGRHPDVLKQQDNVAVSNVQNKNGKLKIPNVRKCLVCQTTTSPLWRNGPKGNKTLCNPCGLQHKKQVWLASLMESTKNKVNEASASNPLKKPKI